MYTYHINEQNIIINENTTTFNKNHFINIILSVEIFPLSIE
jgi:hypothetical protein